MMVRGVTDRCRHLADCDEAIRRADSDDASVYLNRAGVRQLNSDLDGAIADLSKAIQINSNYTQAAGFGK
jgi:hypothetical protein